MDKISVVVPVHNTEKYVGRCIESILNQIGVDIELILIDDGSTDNSLNICKRYKGENQNIVLLVNEKSKGVSYARNKGLKASSGQYISFVDSDDYVEPDFFYSLLSSMTHNSTDIELLAHIKEDENGIVLLKPEKKEKVFVLDDSYDSFSFYAYRCVCGGLYKRKLFFHGQTLAIEFDEKIKIGEDLLVYTKLLTRAGNCHYCSGGPYYHYVQYPDSAIHTFSFTSSFSGILAHKMVVSEFEKVGYRKASSSAKKYLVFKCNDIYEMMRKQNSAKKEDVLLLVREMRELNSFVLNSDFSLKFKVKWLLMELQIF